MSATRKAFTPIKVGSMELLHRIVMAPLTRNRSEMGTHNPRPVMEEYYEQRASKGGLMISEATLISHDAGGHLHTPGIFSPEQVSRWQNVTKRVHNKGGYIFLQLWHTGRATHSSVIGKQIVSSSNIPVLGNTLSATATEVPHEEPRSLKVEEIHDIVQAYKIAAENAIKAGFDGVEIQAANGYLPHQFLEDGVNKRTDEYGGSVENRARFVLEITNAVVEAVGPKRVGIRFSPWNPLNSMSDSDPVSLYSFFDENKYTITQIQTRHPDFAYVHFSEPRIAAQSNPNAHLTHFRKVWTGVFLSCGGYDPKSGIAQIERGGSDLVAFGKCFIANPDLVVRIQNDVTLNPPDFKTFHSTGDQGYVDYPFYKV